jgi:hypothetical protein
MSCIGCNTAITIKKANDETIFKLASTMAKETGKPVGLFRDHEGRLCISTGTDPIQSWVTPYLQGSDVERVH